MKNIKTFLLLLSVTALCAAAVSCGKDDSKQQWGSALVYMPQAAMGDGANSNVYNVPLNNNALTKNYSMDYVTNTLNIFLGVYRSGLQPLQAFSVDVNVDEAATAEAVSNTIRGIELPAEVYTLPTKVTVENGEREKVFYLSIDMAKLLEDYPLYAKNRMVLVVGISNPTKYVLNDKLSQTTVVIDGASFLPAIKIVKGGDFGADAASSWTFTNMDTAPMNPSYVQIKSGALVADAGAANVTAHIALWQQIQLEVGHVYILSAGITCTGNGQVSGSEVAIAIAPTHPVDGVVFDYKRDVQPVVISNGDYRFCDLDTWNTTRGILALGGGGTMPQISTWNDQGMDKTTGQFTVKYDTYYIILIFNATNSRWGTVTLTNITITEQ